MTSIENAGARAAGRRRAQALTALALSALALGASAQSPPTTSDSARVPAARGLYNWVHTTGDAERAFPFYRDAFGLELEHSPFVGSTSAEAPPPRIRTVAEAGSDQLVWNLTNTAGSRFRTVFMHAANTSFGLELSEFFDIPRETRPANAWDPGASILSFEVRNLEATASRLRQIGAPAVTLGERPLETPAGRSILVRDPDGYLVQATQASPTTIANAASARDVVRTSIAISVADTAAALQFYRSLLGFDILETRSGTTDELRLYGLGEGELLQTTASISGTDVTVRFMEFALPTTATTPANPFQWRIQDVGAPQFQLEVRGLDVLLERTHDAGYRFLSVDAKPIERAFGRFVFAIDPDGVLVEFVEPTAPQ